MRGRQGVRILLLVVPVLLGLLGMHALVVAPDTGTGGPHALPAAESTPISVPHTAAATPADAADGGHGAPVGHGGHDGGLGHLLHLCLAVLAGIGAVLLIATGIVLGLAPLPASTGRARRWLPGMAPARPPPVPRRLAQLCVMRN